MSIKFVFNKEIIDKCLDALAKELLKLRCKHEIEIILVGGSSILLNYHFRANSYDIDAYYKSDILKQAISNVTDLLNLQVGWINDDFIKTTSYTSKIIEFSEFYKEFRNILDVRTVSKEYLIAMKLKSFRKYKNDIQDIIGILNEDKTITLQRIKNAVIDLYGSFEYIDIEARNFIEVLLH